MVHVVLLYSMILSFFSKYKKQLLTVAFAVLFLFAALRYEYGNDYLSYKRYFDLIHHGHKVPISEPLFILVFKACPNFEILILLSSLATIIPTYYLIKKFVVKKYWWISVVIFCVNPYIFLMSLSAIRQTMALALFIIAVQFSEDHKLVPYIIFVILASLFHLSAMILLPFYIIANGKKINKWMIAVVLSFVIFLLINEYFLDWGISYVLGMFDNINYNYYASLGETNSLRATLLSSIMLIYIAMNIPHLEGTTLLYSKLYLVGCICAVLAYHLNMFTRIQMYFDIFSIISIPMIMYKNKTSITYRRKILYLVNRYLFPLLIFIVYGLRYYSFFINPMWEPFHKYHSILSGGI